MDLFEFVVGFYVVIAGIGVTLLVKSIGQMIESRDRIRLYADTPALVYGPRAEAIHGFNERVELESMRRVTQATALFIAGPKDWHRVARQMGIRYVMLTDKEGRVHMNPAMQARVKLQHSNHKVIISEPLA